MVDYNTFYYDKYSPAAQTAAAAYQIPWPVFYGVITQESHWNPKVQSPKGAYGLAQLLPGTADQLGVNIEDPVGNLMGGAKYLRQQYDRFGNWQSAMAAYNMGPGNKAGTNGFAAVLKGTRSLPDETKDYVKRVTGYAKSVGWDGTDAALPVTEQDHTAVGGSIVSQTPPVASGYVPSTNDSGRNTAADFIGNFFSMFAGKGSSAATAAAGAAAPAAAPSSGPSTANPNLTAGDFLNPFAKLFGVVDPLGLTGPSVSTTSPNTVVESPLASINAFLAKLSDPEFWKAAFIYIALGAVAIFLVAGAAFKLV